MTESDRSSHTPERSGFVQRQIREALREKAKLDGGDLASIARAAKKTEARFFGDGISDPPELAPRHKGDLQDGMLVHYLDAVKQTDWYAQRENDTMPFDYRDHMMDPPKVRK